MGEQVTEVEQKVMGHLYEKKYDAFFIRRVLNKTQPISYKRHIETRLS